MQDSYFLGKIITTSTGFSTSLLNEQRNVIIIGQDKIQNRGYTTLQDVLQGTQVTFTYNGFNSPNIDMRGQGAAAARAVKVLRNGKSQSTFQIRHLRIIGRRLMHLILTISSKSRLSRVAVRCYMVMAQEAVW